jgi:DNA-binding NarL/FixJ family response regulator
MKRAITILIADDHPLMLATLKEFLPRDPGIEVIGACSSGEEAIWQYRQLQPDVVVMDVYMKPVGGIAGTTGILQDFPEAKIIGISNFYSSADAQQLQESGAKGYMLKTNSLQSMIDCIKTVQAGSLSFASEKE